MEGFVTSDNEVVVRVEVHGPDGQEGIDAVLDTGFNGYLTLPPIAVARLGLVHATTAKATLADGSEVEFDIYEANVHWLNREWEVLVVQASGGALVGMSLLSGHRVTVDVIDGGAVTIEPLA